VLREAEDDEEALKGDLHNGLAKERSSEEDTKGHQEVAAKETSKVKQGIRNLVLIRAGIAYGSEKEDGDEGVLLECLVDQEL